MSVSIDSSQQAIVQVKRKPTGQKPVYFNATQKKELQISDDFEAFLILQGPKNKDTVQWLEQATEFGIRDGDRDALAAVALKNEQDDAMFAELEIGPIIRLFDRFRAGYNINGFEQVTETGALLNDIQRPMLETQNIMARLKNRQVFAASALLVLGDRGMTADQTTQLNSWFTPLTAY